MSRLPFIRVDKRAVVTCSNSACVSLVVTTYNQAALVPYALGSALQNVDAARVVVVDDGSEESDAQRTNAACRDAGVVYVGLRQNCGVSAARMVGLQHVNTPLIMFLDADDVLSEGYVRALANALANSPSAAFAMGQQHFFLTTVGDSCERWPLGEIKDDACWESPCLSGSGVLFRVSDLLAVGGFRACMAGRFEDWDLGLRLMLGGRFGLLVQDAVYHYRRGAQSAMTKIHGHLRAAVDGGLALRYGRDPKWRQFAYTLMCQRYFPLFARYLRSGEIGKALALLRAVVEMSGTNWATLFLDHVPQFARWYVSSRRRRLAPGTESQS